MVFGILEDKHLVSVPGTALLSDLAISRGQKFSIDEARSLKRGLGKYSHVVLMPQPSDDPADPLNWPQWKKEACFWSLAFAATLDGALSPMVGPGYQLLAKQFQVSVDEVTSTFGAILLGLGCFMLIQGPLAVKFGHRIVYFVSVTLMFVACVWCALSPSLSSIRASRVFQGFGMSSIQSLVPSTIEQIFFIHERGARTTIWSFCVMAGITLGPLIYGYVVQNLTWQLGFWFVVIPLGIALLLVFFFVPETTYNRSRPFEIESSEKESIQKDIASDRESRTLPKAPTYLSQLKLWNGTFSDTSFSAIFLRPYPFILSPVTWFMFLSYGLQTAWLSLLPLCSSTIFTIEYGFNASQTGLTNLGGIVGIVLAMLFSAYFTDRGAVWMSKRNKGIYEPEFRLIFMLSMLFGIFGYAGWAVGNSHGMPWIGAVACLTMTNFSMVVSGSAAVTYLLDTHGSDAIHCLALINFLKNMVIYGFSFFVNGMVANRGVGTSLLILAGCQAVCWMASIPMYIYGKRVRSFIARHPGMFVIGKPA